MAEFLITSGISYSIEQILRKAQTEVYLVSPFLQLSRIVEERLEYAINRGIECKMIYKEERLTEAERVKIYSKPKIELYSLDNLHAKCYMNEKEAVMTSMNLYEFSEKNKEFGILINRQKDEELYNELYEEVQSLFRSARRVKKSINWPRTSGWNKHSVGYCIRCTGSIGLNTERPYCLKCFNTWSQFSNPDYQERCCHVCGADFSTSMRKPVCSGCYR